MKLSIQVIPKSSRSQVIGHHNNCLKVKLNSPPVDGAANKELVKLLAKELQISKSHIHIVSGHTSKSKEVAIPDHVSIPQHWLSS